MALLVLVVAGLGLSYLMVGAVGRHVDASQGRSHGLYGSRDKTLRKIQYSAGSHGKNLAEFMNSPDHRTKTWAGSRNPKDLTAKSMTGSMISEDPTI